MAPRDHRRVHANRHRVVVVFSSQMASSLTTEPMSLADCDVGRGHLGDALAVHVGGGDPGVEGEAGQDRGLGGGVEPLDVGGRVGLGVAELLGLLQRLGEAGTGGVHLVEDEVGGAVDDPEHPGHRVAGQRLAQRSHDRDRAGHRGLEVEVAPGLLGGLEQRRAVLGQQRLVGGDDAGAVLERGEDQRAGRLDAADHLDDQVDVVAGDQPRGVGGQQPLGDLDLARRVEPAYGDTDELDRGAHPGRQVAGLLLQQPHHLRADRAAAQHRDLEPSVAHSSHPYVGCEQVVQSLAADDDARRPVPHRDHRRPERVVVVGGHGAAVGAGAGDRDQVAGADVAGQELVLDHDVAGLAVLADDPGQDRRCVGAAAGQGARVVGVVEGGADVVAHPAVDGDIGARSAAVELDLLDRADRVDRAHRRADDRPARLDREPGLRRCRARGTRGPTISLISWASCLGSEGSSWVV